MEFLSLKIAGFLVWTGLAILVGRYWERVNSVSDIEALYTKSKDLVTAEIAKAEAIIEAAKAKVDKLKSLLPNG